MPASSIWVGLWLSGDIPDCELATAVITKMPANVCLEVEFLPNMTLFSDDDNQSLGRDTHELV